MKTGDLVACRFDNSVQMGIITGREKGGHTVVYACGRDIYSTDLPRSRFIRLRVKESFTGLCELDWMDVEAAFRTFDGEDAAKLANWIDKVDASLLVVPSTHA